MDPVSSAAMSAACTGRAVCYQPSQHCSSHQCLPVGPASRALYERLSRSHFLAKGSGYRVSKNDPICKCCSFRSRHPPMIVAHAKPAKGKGRGPRIIGPGGDPFTNDVEGGAGAGALPQFSQDGPESALTVAAYMNKSPICLRRDMSLKEAIKIVIDNKISGAPVVDKYPEDSTGAGRLVGVLSEEDLMWKEAEVSEEEINQVYTTPFYYNYLTGFPGGLDAFAQQALKMLSRTVGDSMNIDPIAVRLDCPLPEAAAIMLDFRISRLPVVGPREEGRPGNTVVGIISRKDILKHVVTLL